VLKRSRAARADLDASYAALWTHLQKRYPRLRTVLITAASSRDDAAVAAGELARAAANLPNVARSGGGSANGTHDRDDLETTPHAFDESPGSVQIVEATTSALTRTTSAQAGGGVALTIVVAPPPQESPECITLASAADATILVATRGRTRSRDARQAANLLRLADVEIAAALLLSENGSRRGAARSANGPVNQLQIAIPAAEGTSTAAGGRPRETS
jgi:hypothetical protein